MSSRGCSHVSLPKAEAVRLAQECLDRINRTKDLRKRELIECERASMAKSWFRKIFRSPEPTDEEILESHCHIGGKMFHIHMYAWGSVGVAERIIKAAQYLKDDDVIQLTLEDLDYIA